MVQLQWLEECRKPIQLYECAMERDGLSDRDIQRLVVALTNTCPGFFMSFGLYSKTLESMLRIEIDYLVKKRSKYANLYRAIEGILTSVVIDAQNEYERKYEEMEKHLQFKEENKEVKYFVEDMDDYNSAKRIVKAINDIVLDKDCSITILDGTKSKSTTEADEIIPHAAILATTASIDKDAKVRIVAVSRQFPGDENNDDEKYEMKMDMIMPGGCKIPITIYGKEMITINIITADDTSPVLYVIKVNKPKQEGPVYR